MLASRQNRSVFAQGSERVLSFEELLVQSEWVPASDRDRCKVCSNKYTPFRRKHHCRLCGEVICGSCTMKKEAELPIIGISMVKICKPCGIACQRKAISKPQRQRLSTVTLTADSAADMLVTQQELDDLEALISPNAVKYDPKPFSGWNVADLDVQWYPADKLRDLRPLSSDTHASVWIVNYQCSKKLVAKRLVKEARTQQAATDFLDDIKLVSKLQHPRIVQLVGCAWTPDADLQALFEYLPGGDLRAYIDSTGSEAAVCHSRKIEKLRIALDIAEALAYVHSLEKPLHHRALESRNVLLTGYNRAKIGGFGAIRIDLAAKSTGKTSDIARWLAPEVLSDSRSYASPCDIYSLGIILTELDTHLIPYSDFRGSQGNVLPTVAVLFMVSLGQARPSLSPTCPPEIRQLTMDCLSFEPQNRPTAIEVVARLRTFIRTLGLTNTLEASKTPQQQQQKAIVLCEESDW